MSYSSSSILFFIVHLLEKCDLNSSKYDEYSFFEDRFFGPGRRLTGTVDSGTAMQMSCKDSGNELVNAFFQRFHSTKVTCTKGNVNPISEECLPSKFSARRILDR